MVKRVAIFCQPRTCSTYFIDAICNEYSIKNHFEFWKGSVKQVLNIHSPKSFDKYKLNVVNATTNLFDGEDFALKFFPTTFYNQFFLKNDVKNYYKIKDYIINDLTYHFRIPEYSDFYFLHRNITDIIISYMHGYKNLWHYSSEGEAINHIPNETVLFTAINTRRYIVDYQIVSHILSEKIEKYLLEKNLQFTKLEFDSVPSYIDNNFSIKNYRFVNSMYDYKKILPNYNKIERQLLERYDFFSELTHDIKFY